MTSFNHSHLHSFPSTRMRRLRSQKGLRSLIRETQLSIDNLICPLFIRHGEGIKNPIHSMPLQYQLSLDNLPAEIEEIQSLKIPAVILFGIPETKDELGSEGYDDAGIIQQAISLIKEIAPDLLIISDCCLCEYTSHGHCGIVNERTGWPDVDNDETLKLLAKLAVSQAAAGSDIIAPSGMLDGMVMTIRKALDREGYENIPILSYAVKYASALYAPFREAAEGAPQFGDRSTYQMDPANGQEALREASLDIQEGADMLLVKPALFYLDIIYKLKLQFPSIPIGAYQVSGEYAMIKAAAYQDWLNEKRIVLESLLAIKRAGASFIVTYFAKEVASWLREKD